MACGVISPNNLDMTNDSESGHVDSRPKVEQPFLKKYSSQFLFYPPSFFKEWSKYTVPLESDSLVNDWYARLFEHYSNDEVSAENSKYEVLPYCIKVKYIEQSFKTIIGYGENEIGGDTWPSFDSLSGNTFYVVPKIPSQKPILYLTQEIEKILDDYLGSGFALYSNSPKQRHPDREKEIAKYIPLSNGPSFSTYSYYTYPLITALYFFDDGVVFELRPRGFSGATIFLPDGQFESEYIVNTWIY